jgi:hypothetical protein
MNLDIDKKILALSCFDATMAWANSEKHQVEVIFKNNIIEMGDFEYFLKNWQVERNTLKSERNRLLNILNLGKFENPSEVYKLAIMAKEKGLSSKIDGKGHDHILPISLVSKFAFCKNPTIFPPIDQWSLSGVNKLRGIKINPKLSNKDYDTYCRRRLIPFSPGAPHVDAAQNLTLVA